MRPGGESAYARVAANDTLGKPAAPIARRCNLWAAPPRRRGRTASASTAVRTAGRSTAT